ncbi:hypothetical protein ACFY9F_33020 [Streptomyces sp. NPDC012421]|uniref:allene oxide cyclase barrel-like domain-containing protein n=1 Tax=unclassified Streptomyces TaxID=2593676 RepID=UPI0036A1EF42
MRPIRTASVGMSSALVALLACTAGSAAATDTESAHDKSKTKVIILTGTLTQQSRFPVNPNGPAAQGDQTVVHSTLTDQAGNTVGETGGICTTTRTEPDFGAETCNVTYSLTGGQITFQGFVFGHLRPGPPPSFDGAITGGTGEYAGARGTVHADTIGPGQRRFTLTLLR